MLVIEFADSSGDDSLSLFFSLINSLPIPPSKIENAFESIYWISFASIDWFKSSSVKFVMKTDETVTIIPIDIEIETVCVWN